MMPKKKSMSESWAIAIRKGYEGEILAGNTSAFQLQKNGVTFWVADPMIFAYEGRVFLFAERYNYFSLRGEIAVAEIKDGKVSRWHTIIREPFHMSYPFVFEQSGTIYMIPETNEGHSVRLYQAISFPYKWKYVKNIIDNVKWVDTTLVPDKNGFLAYTRAHEVCDKDYLVKINQKFSVLSVEELDKEDGDVSYRCGGRIFDFEGKEIHVCQNESAGYGCGLIFRYYDKATKREIKQQYINPTDLGFSSEKWKGTHTYTAAGGYEVVDLKYDRFSFLEWGMKKIKRFKRRIYKAYRNHFSIRVKS